MRREVACSWYRVSAKAVSSQHRGDAGGAQCTVILWDAADRGFFFADWTGGVAESFQATCAVRHRYRGSSLGGAGGGRNRGERFGYADQGVWALSLVYGSLGSDPGAVTYQGEPLADEDATSWLGTVPEALPEGPQDLGQGFLIVTGLPGFDDSGDGVRLNLT